MKKVTLLGVLASMLTAAAVLTAQDAPPGAPQLPQPQAEHAWVQQLVGEWETEAELTMAPGQPPLKCEGTETVRPVGKFWIMSEMKTAIMDMPMHGVMTVGYDPDKKKYVGTWVDSMTSHMWHYEGAVDAAGKVLTLEAEGPNPAAPGTKAKFRDVMEIKDKDHRTFSSAMQGGDGQWTTFVTAKYTRRK